MSEVGREDASENNAHEWEQSPSDTNSSSFDKTELAELEISVSEHQTPSTKPSNEQTKKSHRKRIDRNDKEICRSISIDRKIPKPLEKYLEAYETWENMVYKEDASKVERSPSVFSRHEELSSRMRSILLDWVMEVCEVYKLRRVTYYLCVDYIDRYLTMSNDLPKNQLQLLGITCLFIAAKYEEIYPPKLSEFSYVTDTACSDDEILTKELIILQDLNWNLNPMTVSGWLNLYLQIESKDNCTGDPPVTVDFVFPQYSGFKFVRASLLLDVCSLDVDFLRFPYSVMAASALYYVINKERTLRVSGFSWHHISECVTWMAPFWNAVKRISIPHQSIFQETKPPGSSNFACLKKIIPNLTPDESHSIQHHTITLQIYERAQRIQAAIHGREHLSPEEQEQEIEQILLEELCPSSPVIEVNTEEIDKAVLTSSPSKHYEVVEFKSNSPLSVN